jgi:regulator of nucleoside diphosphate kinase
MSKSKPEPVLPPIAIGSEDVRRLSALANSSMALFPRVAHFLARETERAREVADDRDLRGVVRMGSQVVIATIRPATFEMWCWCIHTKPIFR